MKRLSKFYLIAALASVFFTYQANAAGDHDHDGHVHAHEDHGHPHNDHEEAEKPDAYGHDHGPGSDHGPHDAAVRDDHDHPHDDHGHEHEAPQKPAPATKDDDHGHAHGKDGHDNHAGHGDHDEGPEPVVVTQYTHNSELFMEHPPLVQGEKAKLIIHLTRLSDFSAITKGSLEVKLIPASGKTYTFVDKAPARAGIFLPEITPPFTGKVAMELILTSPQMYATHRIEDVSVYASSDEIPHMPHGEESADAITFLKEQQWRIEFATVPAKRGKVSPAVRAYGRLLLPASGKAIAPAPADGIVRFANAHTPLEVGVEVKAREPLFAITPDGNWGAGLTSLREEYLLAKLELERAEKLFEQEAVAKKRVEEAQIKLRTLAQAIERLGGDRDDSEHDDHGHAHGEHGHSHENHDEVESFEAVARAPFNGVVAEIKVYQGQRVNAGDPLAMIEDKSRLILQATVPVTRLEDFPPITDALFKLGNSDRTYRISELGGSVISLAPLPADEPGFAVLRFQFKNPQPMLIPGTKVAVHLLGDPGASSVMIPAVAVNEDQGQPLVYVHTEGETVEKRYPRLGATDGQNVRVLSGVEPGERVVTKGATAIRLASLSTTEMGHGHAH